MKNELKAVRAKVAEVWTETGDTKTLKLAHAMKREPGQFVMTGLPGFGEAPFAASNHGDNSVELCVRKVGSLTDKLHELEAGDGVWIRGPYGEGYPMTDCEHLIIVGGGTGVASVRSAVEYAMEHAGDYESVRVFLGFRDPREILFERLMPQWRRNLELSVIVDKPGVAWAGDVGVVTKLLEEESFETKNARALVCGPEIMMKYVNAELKDKGFKENQIYVSMERLMQCGIKKCGRCMVGGKYVCRDGPVFRLDEAKHLKD